MWSLTYTSTVYKNCWELNLCNINIINNIIINYVALRSIRCFCMETLWTDSKSTIIKDTDINSYFKAMRTFTANWPFLSVFINASHTQVKDDMRYVIHV